MNILDKFSYEHQTLPKIFQVSYTAWIGYQKNLFELFSHGKIRKYMFPC
jgi:hypothetical protein